jgi:hypothetical protein
MTFQTLIGELKQHGLAVGESGGNLSVTPASRLTDEMRTAIRAYKPILITMLRPDETLPDELVILPSCLNTEVAIKACIDSQRGRKAVA